MIKNNIQKYLDEFFDNPYGISGEKITLIKNYFYLEIIFFKPIKRENLQIGVTKNKKIIYFRDKTNKQYEIIVELNSNKKSNFFRKDYNKSYKIYNSFNHNDSYQKKSYNYFNNFKESFNTSTFMCRCNIL